MEAWTVAGTLASFAGVIVGAWTLYIAHGAREAAQAAARRARERDLVEELEAAQEKINEVGIFVMGNYWMAAYLRAADIQSACSGAAVRWQDSLSENRRNDLLTAGELARSIANIAQELQIKPGQPKKLKATAEAHLRTALLISGALAEARMRMERGDA